MIPLVGFLPPKDPRVVGTVEAIERELTPRRLRPPLRRRERRRRRRADGREGAFLACSFWLVDNLELIGRHDDAVALFERLLVVAQRRRPLSEEYDPVAQRLVGNFPQAFSHISLVNTAVNLCAEQEWTAGMSHRPGSPGTG